MTSKALHWAGTPEESLALLTAAEHQCTCEFDATGTRCVTCPTHQLLAGMDPHDQRVLDGLLTFRRLRARLLREEGLAA